MSNEKVLELCTEELLKDAVGRFGGTEKPKFVDISESVVYEFKKSGKDFILRLSHRKCRTTELIHAELDWMNYLAQNGASVPRAYPSENGKWIEIIETPKKTFRAVCFEKAKGGELKDDEFDDQYIEEWGRMTGKLHALTKNYQPGTFKRFDWTADEDVARREEIVPPSQTMVLQKFSKLIDQLHALPKDKNCYGLIHGDIHLGNFFVNDHKITLFDFDDCFYCWFIYDIMVAFNNAIFVGERREGKENLKPFIEHFMNIFRKGYEKENQLNQFWWDQLPLFLKLREIHLYVYMHRICDMDNLDDDDRDWFAVYKYRIENNILYFGRDLE